MTAGTGMIAAGASAGVEMGDAGMGGVLALRQLLQFVWDRSRWLMRGG